MDIGTIPQPPQVDVNPSREKYLVIPADKFQSNYNLDVTAYIEKKQGLEYLSWGYAYLQLKLRHPEIFVEFKDDKTNRGMPFELKGTASTYFTMPYLTDGEKTTPALYFPILDYKNQPIKNVDSFAYNTARMRAAVKAIAIYTGIGLCLFTQEHNLEDSDYAAKQNAVSMINEVISKLGGASKLTTVTIPEDLSIKSMEELRELYVSLKSEAEKQKPKTASKKQTTVPV